MPVITIARTGVIFTLGRPGEIVFELNDSKMRLTQVEDILKPALKKLRSLQGVKTISKDAEWVPAEDVPGLSYRMLLQAEVAEDAQIFDDDNVGKAIEDYLIRYLGAIDRTLRVLREAGDAEFMDIASDPSAASSNTVVFIDMQEAAEAVSCLYKKGMPFSGCEFDVAGKRVSLSAFYPKRNKHVVKKPKTVKGVITRIADAGKGNGNVSLVVVGVDGREKTIDCVYPEYFRDRLADAYACVCPLVLKVKGKRKLVAKHGDDVAGYQVEAIISIGDAQRQGELFR